MKIYILIAMLLVSATNAVAEGAVLISAPQNPSKRFLHTGFTFDAVLRTAIFSYNTNTPVIAETEFDVSFLGRSMIPKGTKLIGTSAIEKTDDRVNVAFHTMVFPDGSELKFNGLALWTDGSAGIIGKKDKKKSVLPAKILLTAASTGVSMAADSNSVPNEMVKGLATDAQTDLAQKQETSVSVAKDIGILIYIVDRLEY
jgi:type IV secretory pathway VirB10-like protein